jgi:hypothetical protein
MTPFSADLEGRLTVQFNSVMKERWKKALGASLTIALLSAVAGVGITLFSSEVLAAWKTQGKAEQSLSSSGALEGLLNFEAPAATAARLATEKEDANQSKTETSGQVVKNWKFTQSPVLDAYLLSWALTLEAVQLEGLITFIELSNPFLPASIVNFLNAFELAWVQTAIGFQNFLNSFIPVGFRPPPIPPISPHF